MNCIKVKNLRRAVTSLPALHYADEKFDVAKTISINASAGCQFDERAERLAQRILTCAKWDLVPLCASERGSKCGLPLSQWQ